MDLILLVLHVAELGVLLAIFRRLRVPPPLPSPPVVDEVVERVVPVPAPEPPPVPPPSPVTLPVVAAPLPVAEDVTCAHGGRHGRHAETGILLCRECIAAGRDR